jgi:transcriptional regulator with XRE-family HTH domain
MASLDFMPTLKHGLSADCNMFNKLAFTIFVMTTLESRVARAISESGAEVRQIANACGVSVQAVYAWLRGDVKNMRNETLFAFADVTGFEARWIGTGDGPEKSPAAANHRIGELIANYSRCDERGKATVLTVAEREARWGDASHS